MTRMYRLAVVASFGGAVSSASSSLAGEATTTRRPSSEDWTRAALVEPERRHGPLAERCHGRSLPGLLEVRCDFPVSAITQLAGSQNGVRLAGESPGENQLPRSASVRVALASAPRVFLFWTLGEGYDGPLTVVPGVVLSTDGARDGVPHFRLHDALHEPVRTAQSQKRRAPSTPPHSPPSTSTSP